MPATSPDMYSWSTAAPAPRPFANSYVMTGTTVHSGRVELVRLPMRPLINAGGANEIAFLDLVLVTLRGESGEIGEGLAYTINGISIARRLGVRSRPLPVYFSGGLWADRSVDELCATASDAVGLGFRGLKLRLGSDKIGRAHV